MDFIIDIIAPFKGELAELIVAVIFGAIAWMLRSFFGVQIDASRAARLHEAIENGIGYALSALEREARDALPDTLVIENEIVERARNYVTETMPDTLKHFGLTPSRLEKLIESKLPFALDIDGDDGDGGERAPAGRDR